MKQAALSAFHSGCHRGRRSLTAALLAGLLAFLAVPSFASTATAAAPDLLFRTPADDIGGDAAGRLSGPRGIAANPDTGHLYVSDAFNSRIAEFTAWGTFVKAWGWDVAPEGAPGDTASDKLEVCTTICQTGSEGTGAGQLGLPFGITLDSAGDLYVYEITSSQTSARVQKFDPEGNFLLMFGGEVNETTKANLCTKADLEGGEECGVGVTGMDPGQFSKPRGGNYIAYNPATDTVFVGDVDRIEEFDTDGTFKAQIPFEGALQAFDGRSVIAMAADSAGNLYLGFGNTKDLYKLSSSGEPLSPGKPAESKFKVSNPEAVAVDAAGSLYAVDGTVNTRHIAQFDAAGSKLLPTKAEEEAYAKPGSSNALFPYIPFQGPSLNGLATNVLGPGSESPGDLYVSFWGAGDTSLHAYGPAPIAFEDPPKRPPEIAEQYAISVGRSEATLRAEINPLFWPDTTYRVQYGTGKCSEGGCTSERPPPPGSTLTDQSTNSILKTAGVLLGDLQAGTTYHYRFVTQSSGSEGAEVFGEEESFHTFPAPTPAPSCPANEAFRSGPSAKLPDCRAYEMVSPLEKEGGDAALAVSAASKRYQVNQSARSGERFTYTSVGAFAGAESAPYLSQQLASRDAETGWSTRSLSPPRTSRPLQVGFSLINEFRAFSPDLCEAWLFHNSGSTLAEGAIPDYANVYRRESCGGAPFYEALSTAKPPSRPAEAYLANPVGFSADGSQTVFLANDALTPDAPALPELGVDEQKEMQLYEHGPEGLRFVCHLPNGTSYAAACAAGMAAGTPNGRASAVQNAISADGSRVFWTAYKGDLGIPLEGIPGQIYLRQNPDQAQSEVKSGECTEAEKACTIAVSGTVSPEPAEYWAAADDGSKAIFEIAKGPLKDNLYEFDVEARKARLIAGGVLGPMGVSEDASRIYFASSKVLGEGASEGAKEGAPNLYLYEAPQEEGEGSFHFVMALTTADFGTEVKPRSINEVPITRSSTVSADGLHAAFTSATSPTPTGYDNLDAESGEPDEEVYLYDATQEELRCVSCNPTGTRPAGEDGTAARLPAPAMSLVALHPLSEDGSRLFFESHEALVPRDSNGTWDVYQWEAPGAGACTEADSTYGEASGGCVELISSGQSPSPSILLDADATGNNVFIGTQASLIAADYGLHDVYDARVGGGLPEAPSPPAACEGEACQGTISPPNDPTPSSASFQGAGNVREGTPSCRKPKVRRKGRCVTKQRKRAKHNRRQSR